MSGLGYTYVACGNSTNKKDAQTNAAKDFLMFLTRQGELAEGEGLQETHSHSSGGDSVASGHQNLGLQRRGGAFQDPQALGQAYQPVGQAGGSFRERFLDQQREQQQLGDAEDIDVNAGEFETV